MFDISVPPKDPLFSGSVGLKHFSFSRARSPNERAMENENVFSKKPFFLTEEGKWIQEGLFIAGSNWAQEDRGSLRSTNAL